MTNGRSDSSHSLGFDFEEDPRDLDDSELSACPLPPLAAGQRIIGGLPAAHLMPGHMMTVTHAPMMTRPPGAPPGTISAVQTTQNWKTYRLLAHCFVARNYMITGSTDIIGGIHPGSVVVAAEEKGNRIKIRIPTFGWYSSNDYQSERFGWMDIISPTGERLAVPMPPRMPVITGAEGEVVIAGAPKEAPAPLFLPNHDATHTAVYQPTTPKDLPGMVTTPQGEITPSPRSDAVMTPKATAVSPWVAVAAVSPRTGAKKPVPLLRKPSLPLVAINPVPNTNGHSGTNVVVPGADQRPGAKLEKSADVPRSRKRRMPQFRDKHQATVSHTPGVILYPRDPVTGHVIIPKHIIAARRRCRRKRRPPCKSRRGPNPWQKNKAAPKAKA